MNAHVHHHTRSYKKEKKKNERESDQVFKFCFELEFYGPSKFFFFLNQREKKDKQKLLCWPMTYSEASGNIMPAKEGDKDSVYISHPVP